MRTESNGVRAAEKAQEVFSASRKMARKASTQAKTFIHEKPVLSTLLGVGAGFLLAFIVRGRD